MTDEMVLVQWLLLGTADERVAAAVRRLCQEVMAVCKTPPCRHSANRGAKAVAAAGGNRDGSMWFAAASLRSGLPLFRMSGGNMRHDTTVRFLFPLTRIPIRVTHGENLFWR